MKLMLLMSVSGSLMMVFYLLFKLLVKDRADAKWRYRILKAALFFYLVPIQAVKPEWQKVYYCFFMGESRQAVWLNKDIVQVAAGRIPKYSIYYIWKYIYAAAVIIIFIALLYKMLAYIKECRIALKHPAGRSDDRVQADIQRQTDRLGIKRQISSRICSGSRNAFTIGIFRPVIVLDDLICDGEERELMIRHELTHIKSWDSLVRLLGIVAAAVHFFNPLVYYLFYELSQASELACDEKVVFQMDEQEMRRYCRLLYETSQRKKKGLYRLNFGRNSKKKMKERIEMMVKGRNRKKGWQVFSGAVLSVMILAVSSITTFAYEPPAVLDLNGSEKEVEHGHGEVNRVFVSDEYEVMESFFDIDISEMSFEESDTYFVDEQGNRYDVSKNDARLFCNHTYTSGKYQEHVKNGTGCTVYIYNAEMCSKCGVVHVMDLYSQTSYPTCPH